MDGNWTSSSSKPQGKEVTSNPQHQQSQMSGSEDEAEDEDSESSALNNFRKQWEAELKQSSLGNKKNTPNAITAVSPAVLTSFSPRLLSKSQSPVPGMSSNDDLDKIEEEAKKLFLMGVGFERRGDFYDAVRFYRRAMQLIPDIEHRLTLQSEQPGTDSETEMEDDLDHSSNNDRESDGNEDDDGRPLYSKFIQYIEANGWKFFEQFKDDKKTHISGIPVEILLYILRWVVSSELDVRSLDILATVCRGFYCLSREDKLWKMASERVWTSSDIIGSEFSNYREMFLSRPRVRFDGCYISRITYVRPGEHSFQDASYRPWHMVEYFRYLRFFPDGKLYFLTTAEKPGVTVGSLRDRVVRNVSILKGTYRLVGNDVVSASVRKSTQIGTPGTYLGRPGKSSKQPQDLTEFNMDFDIEELKGKNNWVLRWTYYAVYINNSNIRNNNRNNNGEVGGGGGGITTTFELSSNKYPPFYFSRVKSYTRDSESILE